MLHHDRQLDCSIFFQCDPWSMVVVKSGLRSSSWVKLKLDDQDTFWIGICRCGTVLICVHTIILTHFYAQMLTFLSGGLSLRL